MSTSGVHPDDMDPLSAHAEELLLTGRVPNDQAELEGVATLFARLRDGAAATPAPSVGPELATLFRDGAPAVAPARTRSFGITRRHPRRVAAGIAAAAGFLGMSGLGVAGALPGPAQAAVARVADVVGIELPDGRPDPVPATDTTPADPATPAEPPATPGEGPADPAVPATPATPVRPTTPATGRPESPPSSVPTRADDDGQPGSPPAHAPATGRPADPGPDERASRSEDRAGAGQPAPSAATPPADPSADHAPSRSDEQEPGAPSTSLTDRLTDREASNREAAGHDDVEPDTTHPARNETAQDDAGETP